MGRRALIVCCRFPGKLDTVIFLGRHSCWRRGSAMPVDASAYIPAMYMTAYILALYSCAYMSLSPTVQIKTSNDIGALIRGLRSGLGWTQEELARRVGVSRLWVVQLEKGKPTAQIGLALRALKELGVTLDASSPTSTSSDRAADPMIDLNRVIRGTLPPKS